MVFSSSIFLLYFLPLFFFFYYIADVKYKNWIALIASLIFYGFGAPKFLFIIFFSVAIDFFIVKRIDISQNQKERKWLLFASVVLNIGLLAYFKYANFFVENLNYILWRIGIEGISWTKVILPIGISFYTFQKLSYSIDIYRGKSKRLDSIFDYLLFILLFPQLIAGPIVRYNEIAIELVDRKKNENIDNRILGLYRFMIGLAKKVLIANTLGQVVDTIFAGPAAEIGTLTAWIGIIAYSFQIYYDFSGYSDMGIGIGRMIGFKFPENFNNPYISQNISEFWRRWHMTLGSWMKDYLYIPLGGNKVKSKYRLYFNLWIVFIISGLWHGAAWNFVVWGAFHGLFLVLDRLFLIKLFSKIGTFTRIFITYIITLIGWVIFRAESLKYAIAYIQSMFKFDGNLFPNYMDKKFWVFLFIGSLFAFIGISKFGSRLEKFFFYSDYNIKQYIFVGTILLFLSIISLSFVTKGGFNPFIYFRF
ncbi:MAG TPA: MBOAT family O-acyltransferase [Bacteroidales bacterium]|nr:MBOAT family O-acyltransferase [Bacteroidales bacterium]